MGTWRCPATVPVWWGQCRHQVHTGATGVPTVPRKVVPSTAIAENNPQLARSEDGLSRDRDVDDHMIN
jgi:hypothetical protein